MYDITDETEQELQITDGITEEMQMDIAGQIMNISIVLEGTPTSTENS